MYQRILVPLDGSELAERVLPHAISLAKALGVGVTLLRTNPYPIHGGMEMDYPASLYEGVIQENTAEAEEYLRSVGQRLSIEGMVKSQTQVVLGEPAVPFWTWLATHPPR